MIIKGQRRTSNPIIISENNDISLLQRIPFSERTFSESWLQEIIQNNSSLLPIEEIEPSFSDSVSLAREIKTKVGFIDNLLINNDGYITIIETKLWRNVQARREVVGQIIDYAKELTKWTYDDLNDAVVLSNQTVNNSSKGVIDILKQNSDVNELDEKYFIDSVSKNLKRGRFLLLIVGDGIHESVEEMVDYLQQFAQINFTLALVELHIYKNITNNSLIVLPQIIVRTKEITRAVIRIENNSTKEINVDVQTNLEEVRQDKIQVRTTLTYEDFFEQLKHNTNDIASAFVKQVVSDCEKRGMFIELGQSSIGFKLIDNNSNKISIFFIDRKDYFYLWSIGKQLNRRGYDAAIGNKFVQEISDLFGVKLNFTSDMRFRWVNYLRIKDLQNKYDLFLEKLNDFIVEFNNQMNNQNS